MKAHLEKKHPIVSAWKTHPPPLTPLALWAYPVGMQHSLSLAIPDALGYLYRTNDDQLNYALLLAAILLYLHAIHRRVRSCCTARETVRVITQGTKSFYILDADDLPRGVERLRAAGYRETPFWYLLKDGYGVLIRPKQTHKRLVFTIIAHDLTWQEYGHILDQQPIERVIGDVQAAGWQPQPSYCFSGNKAVVYLRASRYRARGTYHLEIKGFGQPAVRDILNQIGVSKI